jgi:hypothetical protein
MPFNPGCPRAAWTGSCAALAGFLLALVRPLGLGWVVLQAGVALLLFGWEMGCSLWPSLCVVRPSGFPLQGRYVLPLSVGLPVFAAAAWAGSRASEALRRYVLLAVGVALSCAGGPHERQGTSTSRLATSARQRASSAPARA